MTKEIWDALSTTFFDGTDEVRVFTLNQKVFATKHSWKSVTNYFGELITIFQELGHCDTIVMSCDRDIKAHVDWITWVQESYAYVCREADRREAMKNKVSQSEAATMVVRRPFQT